MSAIYKCFIVRRGTEAWYSLSEDEQTKLMEKVEQARKDAGGEMIAIYNVGWSNDGALFFGVEKFPDIEAVQKHGELLAEINWGRYIESESFLGTESE